MSSVAEGCRPDPRSPTGVNFVFSAITDRNLKFGRAVEKPQNVGKRIILINFCDFCVNSHFRGEGGGGVKIKNL